MANRKQSSPASTGKTCRQVTDLVLDYLSDRLSPGLKREFEKHLSICPDCVSFLNTYKKTVAVSKAVKPTDMPARVRDSIVSFLRQRARRIGAFLLYLVSYFTT